MTQQNTLLIQSLYDAFKEGDIGTVIGSLADDIEWTEAEGFPTAGTYTNPQDVLEGVFGPLVEEVPDFQAVPDTFIAEDNQVIALGTYMGTHRDTDRSFEARFCHHWTVQGDEIIRFEQFVDTVPVQAAYQGKDLI